MSDPIADALIRIKNGYKVGKESVVIPYSKLILKIMKLLQDKNYISGIAEKEREILINLKYNKRQPAIMDIKRVSKPSLRIYRGSKDLPYVLNGLGIAIISTPKGVMSDKDARKQKLGGEVMALIW